MADLFGNDVASLTQRSDFVIVEKSVLGVSVCRAVVGQEGEGGFFSIINEIALPDRPMLRGVPQKLDLLRGRCLNVIRG